MSSELSAPYFHDEDAAFARVEEILWPNGPVCPFCGSPKEHIGRLTGKTARPGLHKCYGCRKQFTVRKGTVLESSHAPLRYWLQAIHLICSSKKGISTNQLQRTLGVSMQTAWFMAHRIRKMMEPTQGSPVGGSRKTVETDETYITKSPKTRREPGERSTTQVVSLVERGGKIRSVYVDHRTVREVLNKHLDKESHLYTDGAQHYKNMLPVVSMKASITAKRMGAWRCSCEYP